jgi:hypothetical protein
MVQKAVNLETAREVKVAEDLARLGGNPAVIERLTGFGPRWVRACVRRHNGPLAQKPRDPLRRFGDDPLRLLHAWIISSVMYDFQPSSSSPGARLLGAYLAYRGTVGPPGVLDINECAQIIELYCRGEARLRPCAKCRVGHLVLSEGSSLCAYCLLKTRTFCQVCHQPMPPSPRHPRLYHPECVQRTGDERAVPPGSLAMTCFRNTTPVSA